MASPAEGHDVPKPPPRAESERAEPPSHPEPACLEAQKWIEVSDGQRKGELERTESGYKYAAITGSLSPVVGATQCRFTVWDNGAAACVKRP